MRFIAVLAFAVAIAVLGIPTPSSNGSLAVGPAPAYAGVKSAVGGFLIGRGTQLCARAARCRGAILKGAKSGIQSFVRSKAGQNLAGKAADAAERRVPEIGRKLEYLFGNATGRQHNLDRSASMMQQLRRIGINDTKQSRDYITKHLEDVLNDPSSFKEIKKSDATARESLIMGPRGGALIESLWENNKLLSAIIKGGPK